MVVAACLLLEYGVSAAAVAVGWSQYLNELLDNLFGFTIPESLVAGAGAGRHLQPARRDPDRALHAAADPRRERVGEGQRDHGADQARRAGAVHRRRRCRAGTRDNLSDFAPFGFDGITSAAGIIFFSYIGLDAVSTAGEEVKNPRRTMPLAIIIALVIVTDDLHRWSRSSPSRRSRSRTSRARRPACPRSSRTSPGRPGRRTVLAAGAVISIFSVTLVVIYGQTRILFAMGRDGMIPRSSTR